MLRCLYTAATGMDAQQTKMDTIANNLANASTTGFKKERADFEDLLSEQIRGAAEPDPRGGTPPTPLEVGLGVRVGSTTRTFSQGDLEQTSNPLDLAIQGGGFFKVQRPGGDYAYTRAGNLRVDGDGHLVTQNGEKVQPEINVPPETSAITIAADGTISATIPNRTDPQKLGQLELATFINPAGLTSLGNNLLAQSVTSGEPMLFKPGEQGTGTLAQGFLESSNVKAVEEMVSMISTQRAYEMNSKVIQTADQMLQRITTIR